MKKALSILMALAVFASAFSGISVFAYDPSNISVTENSEFVSKIETDSQLLSANAIVTGNLVTEDTTTPFTLSSEFDTSLKTDCDNGNEITYGRGDFYATDGLPDIAKCNGSRYSDVKYDLGVTTNISKILICSSNKGAFITGHYKLYASETNPNPENNEENLIYDYKNTANKVAQTFTLTGENYARYVTFRIVCPVAYVVEQNNAFTAAITEQNWNCVYVRMFKFLVYGEYKDAFHYDASLSGIKNTIKVPDLTTYSSITNSSNTEMSLTMIRYKRNSETENWTSETANVSSALYDGIGQYNQNLEGGFFVDTTNKIVYLDGTKRYVDLIYDFGRLYDISKINIVHGNDGSLITGHYKIFASETESRNFTDDDLVADYYNNNADRTQTFSISDGKKCYARYVALRIINPVNQGFADGTTPPSEWLLTTSYGAATRIGQFQVYGTKAVIPGVADFSLTGGAASFTAGNNTNEYQNKINVKKNLIADKLPESLTYINADKGVTTPANTSGVVDKVTSSAGAFDGQTQGGGSVAYVTGNSDSGSFTVTGLADDESKQYLQMVYALDAEASITDVTVFGHTSLSLSPSHYKLSFADNAEDLFTATAQTCEVNNSTFCYTTVTLDEPVTCKYVGVRVICGVTNAAIGGTMNQSSYYCRITHLDVHGVYTEGNTVVDNLTIAPQHDFINVSKGDYTGRIDNNGNGAPGSTYVNITADETAYNGDTFYTFDGWYNGEEKLSSEVDYSFKLTDTATTLTAKYTEDVSRTVNFIDSTGINVYTSHIKDGELLPAEEIYAASHSVPEIHGFVRQLDENGLQIWTADVMEIINSDVTFKAVYKKSDTLYDISVADTKGAVENKKQAFDTKIVVSDDAAKSWKLDGSIVSYGASATLFVCGDMNITASAENSEPVDTVSILTTIKNGNTMSALARICNVSGKTVTKCGVMFMTGTSYAVVGNVDWTPENLQGKKTVKIEINNPLSNNFMGTLINISLKNNVRRVAEAYVTFSDGTTIYSSASAQDFNSIQQNPIVTAESKNTSDPFVTYHDGYYYHCYSSGDSVYITKNESLFSLGNPIETKCIYTNIAGNPISGSWFAPELHMVDGTWYVYAAPCVDNSTNHAMCVLGNGSSDPMAGTYTNYGKMTGMDDSSWLNIDGTILEYNGKKYFLWSIQGSILIDEMTGPTTLKGTRKTLVKKDYIWEGLVEGPAVINHNGHIFLAYSTNDSQSDSYCMGLLSFTGTDIMEASSWTKNPEPIVSMVEGVYGPGHCSFTKVLNNGNWVDYIVYHANRQSAAVTGSGWNDRCIFVQSFGWDIYGNPVFQTPSKDIT